MQPQSKLIATNGDNTSERTSEDRATAVMLAKGGASGASPLCCATGARKAT